MRITWPLKRFAGALPVLFFLAGQAMGGLPKLSEKQLAQLESGDLVKVPVSKKKGSGYLGGKSYILLEANPSTCYKIMVDLKNYYFFYDDTLIEAKVLKKDGNIRTIKMVYGKGPVKMTYHAKYTLLPKKNYIKFKLDESYENDLLDAMGYMKFTPYDDTRILMTNATYVRFEEKVVWNLFGKKIANGMLKLPKYLKKFLATPESKKYKVASN